MSDSLIGSVVDGRYAITALIGRGGMATVYRARDKRLERDVAVKFMHTHLGAHPDFTERFNREARAAARLSSPYVVAVHDRGVWASPEGTRAYLVMEYVPGPDLRAELSRLGSFTLGTSLALGEQVLRALTSAHAAGIVHRDVKPENIMLTAPVPSPPETLESHPDVYAKVTDFGLARAVTSNATATGQVMGTVAYLAPEVITDGDAGERADLYALGVLLYEFLTGSLPRRPSRLAAARGRCLRRKTYREETRRQAGQRQRGARRPDRPLSKNRRRSPFPAHTRRAEARGPRGKD